MPPSLQRRWGPLVPVPRPAGLRHSIWIQRLHLKKVRRRFFRLSLGPRLPWRVPRLILVRGKRQDAFKRLSGRPSPAIGMANSSVSHASTDSRVKAVGPSAETAMICAAQMGIRKVGFWGGVT